MKRCKKGFYKYENCYSTFSEIFVAYTRKNFQDKVEVKIQMPQPAQQ
jgi:hypothetical protein